MQGLQFNETLVAATATFIQAANRKTGPQRIPLQHLYSTSLTTGNSKWAHPFSKQGPFLGTPPTHYFERRVFTKWAHPNTNSTLRNCPQSGPCLPLDGSIPVRRAKLKFDLYCISKLLLKFLFLRNNRNLVHIAWRNVGSYLQTGWIL